MKKILFLATALYVVGNTGVFATENALLPAPVMNDKAMENHGDHFTPEQKKMWHVKKEAHKAHWDKMTPQEKEAHMAARKEHKAHWDKKTDAEKALWHKEHGHDHGRRNQGHPENTGIVPPAQ